MNANLEAALQRAEAYTGARSFGWLRDDEDRRCFLGVLCDAHADATGTSWEQLENGHWAYDGSQEMLGPNVAQWLGFDGPTEIELATVPGITSAARHSDMGLSWKYIAQLIRSRYGSPATVSELQPQEVEVAS